MDQAETEQPAGQESAPSGRRYRHSLLVRIPACFCAVVSLFLMFVYVAIAIPALLGADRDLHAMVMLGLLMLLPLANLVNAIRVIRGARSLLGYRISIAVLLLFTGKAMFVGMPLGFVGFPVYLAALVLSFFGQTRALEPDGRRRGGVLNLAGFIVLLLLAALALPLLLTLGVQETGNTRRKELQARCDGGDSHSCNNLGWMWHDGQGGPQDLDRATELYERACEAGLNLGCANAARMWDMADPVWSRKLFERACDDQHPRLCTGLAHKLENGYGGPVDGGRARKLLGLACDAGNEFACADLGRMWRFGIGGPRDAVRARQLFTRGCELGGYLAYFFLGQVWESGEGGLQDLARAQKHYDVSCNAGHEPACKALEAMNADVDKPW